MADQIKYICSCCGKEHDEWPALTFNSPLSYHVLTQQDKDTIAEIDSDFCVITRPDQTDRFIRVTLNQKVNGHCADLEYGLWVSLSETSFNDYSENYNNNNHSNGYFGWLSNTIPGYKFDESVPMDVYTQTGNQRPIVIPHQDFDHPFVHDYYNGITKQEAERRIEALLGKINNPASPQQSKRPWWKVW